MFLIHIATAWVLWRVFYWKWPYAVALAVVAGAAQWFVGSLTGSTFLSILASVLLAVIAARYLHRESILRPTSGGG